MSKKIKLMLMTAVSDTRKVYSSLVLRREGKDMERGQTKLQAKQILGVKMYPDKKTFFECFLLGPY